MDNSNNTACGEPEVLAKLYSDGTPVTLTDAGMRLSRCGEDDVDLIDRAHIIQLQARIANLEEALRSFVDWQTDEAGTTALVDDEVLWQRAEAALNGTEYEPWPFQGIPGTSFQALNAKANAGDM